MRQYWFRCNLENSTIMKGITFLALLFFATLSLTAQNGEILYTDFEPDLCISAITLNYQSDTIRVDFDEDGIIDLRLYISRQTSVVDRVATTKSSWMSRDRRNQNDLLVPGNNWRPSNYEWGFWFYNDLDPYTLDLELGFKKVVGNENYYAWVNIHATREITNSNDKIWVYLDKYAYCTIHDYPLQWGQTDLDDGIGENPSNGIVLSVYPNPAGDVVSINFAQDTECQSVKIYSLDGRLMQTFQETSLQTANQTTLDISGLTAGVYVMKLTMADGTVLTERIVKE